MPDRKMPRDQAESCAEIYRIVSSKVLDTSESTANPIGAGKTLEISKAQDSESKGGKCC